MVGIVRIYESIWTKRLDVRILVSPEVFSVVRDLEPHEALSVLASLPEVKDENLKDFFAEQTGIWTK